MAKLLRFRDCKRRKECFSFLLLKNRDYLKLDGLDRLTLLKAQNLTQQPGKIK